ncbi:hypothetical protein B296_00012385 [Ensete ventricosum]|uniref:Reverse transcriptase domain-containing protein n=1 Tax=Ensete ventricosum TaxID=4639 RepID=A0A426ZTI6_ENSVE|nr:hypothetical protein B296_00012385 [Ensete ventricosum]
MKSGAEDRDHIRYCHFHRDYGHATKECYDLKNQIVYLIHCGHLDQYIMKSRKSSLRLKGPMERQVDIIVGGPAAGGVSSSIRKSYARAEVQKRLRALGDPGITFESESEYPDQYDAQVITARIANAHVRRIMIDTESSTKILYLDAFQKLGMTNRDFIPMTSTLTRFTRDAITPVGIATLPITFDDEPRTKTFMIRSDPRESRRCYLATTTIPKRGKETSVVDPREPYRPDTRPEPTKPILEVPLEKGRPERTVRVGLALPEYQRI